MGSPDRVHRGIIITSVFPHLANSQEKSMVIASLFTLFPTAPESYNHVGLLLKKQQKKHVTFFPHLLFYILCKKTREDALNIRSIFKCFVIICGKKVQDKPVKSDISSAVKRHYSNGYVGWLLQIFVISTCWRLAGSFLVIKWAYNRF